VTNPHSDTAGATGEVTSDEIDAAAENAAREQKLARLQQLFRRNLPQEQQASPPEQQPLFDCLVRYRLDQS
jgi:hypothetical protein